MLDFKILESLFICDVAQDEKPNMGDFICNMIEGAVECMDKPYSKKELLNIEDFVNSKADKILQVKEREEDESKIAKHPNFAIKDIANSNRAFNSSKKKYEEFNNLGVYVVFLVNDAYEYGDIYPNYDEIGLFINELVGEPEGSFTWPIG